MAAIGYRLWAIGNRLLAIGYRRWVNQQTSKGGLLIYFLGTIYELTLILFLRQLSSIKKTT